MTITFLQPPLELTRWQALTAAEKTAEVRQAMAEGKSYAQTAEALGTSRVAIAGVVERSRRSPDPIRSSSGLKNQKKGEAGGKTWAAAKAAKKARARTKPKHAGFHKFVALAIPEDAIERTPARQDVWEALPGSSPVAIADHHEGACRWPCGENRPFFYCNEPVKADSPYCSIHSALAFREPPPRKDNGRRDSA